MSCFDVCSCCALRHLIKEPHLAVLFTERRYDWCAWYVKWFRIHVVSLKSIVRHDELSTYCVLVFSTGITNKIPMQVCVWVPGFPMKRHLSRQGFLGRTWRNIAGFVSRFWWFYWRRWWWVKLWWEIKEQTGWLVYKGHIWNTFWLSHGAVYFPSNTIIWASDQCSTFSWNRQAPKTAERCSACCITSLEAKLDWTWMKESSCLEWCRNWTWRVRLAAQKIEMM